MALFGPKSLEDILATFTKTQSDLELYVDTTRQESRDLYTQANDLEKQAYDKNISADRADRVIEKIKAILD